MAYLGDFRLGSTLDFKFCTVNTSGVPTTLAGSPVISAYPDNSLTEITAGITLTVDFDSRTGLHNVRVVATSGNGYATATNYEMVVTAGTVGGSSIVGYVVGTFSIEARSALMPTTAARTLDVTATGEAGVDWANVGAPTTVLNLSGTTVAAVSGAVGSVTGAVGSVGAGGIAAASFAAGAIDAAAIAASAIGTSEFAAAVDARIADAIWDEVRSGHTTQGTYGENNAAVISASAISGTLSTTQMTTDLTNATNDSMNGRTVIFKGNVTAALTGQATNITAYVGASKLVTFTAVTTAPANGDLFIIV